MRQAILFNDLLTAPPQEQGYGIYWLRLYGDGARPVAVVTEVPGNPGQSVMNASEVIVEEIGRRFEIETASLACFIIMPAGFTEATRKAWRVHVVPRLRWDDVSIADIEGVLGHPLEPIPAHEELFERVLALGGDPEDKVQEPVFEAIAVEQLPAHHLPFKCALADRFEAMKADLTDEASELRGVASLGERFLGSLTVADRASCPFHAPDWRSVADESVRILKGSPFADQEGLVARARSAALPPVERRWLTSLFDTPLIVHEGSFGDGQHRGCAVRFGGASRAVVVRCYKSTPVEPAAWIYSGDG
jgi:hypothetical protein